MAKTKFNPKDVIDAQILEIDGAIESIERRMRPYEELAETKNKLLASRRALLGGSRLTGVGGTRLTLEDILSYVKEHAGSSTSEMAQRFGVQVSTVSSHIYRNKDRFINKEGRYWVRDPKNGLNDEHDIKEGDVEEDE